MSKILTNQEIKNLVVDFHNFDLKYIDVENDGTIEREFIKPLLNGFYPNYIADKEDFTFINADIKKATALLIMDLVVAKMGKSKTQNMGELESFTNKGKTVDSVSNKRDELYSKGIKLLIDVGQELISNSEAYTGFDIQKIYLDFNFRNSFILV